MLLAEKAVEGQKFLVMGGTLTVERRAILHYIKAH